MRLFGIMPNAGLACPSINLRSECAAASGGGPRSSRVDTAWPKDREQTIDFDENEPKHFPSVSMALVSPTSNTLEIVGSGEREGGAKSAVTRCHGN